MNATTRAVASTLPNMKRTVFEAGRHIPSELKERIRWIVWLGNKQPCTPGGQPLTRWQVDASRWMTFDVALAAYEANPELCGIGFVLTPDFDIVAVDLDHVIDAATGEVEAWAFDEVHDLGGYAEVSQSGAGLHVFVRGALPPGCPHKVGQREIYDRGRYIAITGNVHSDRPVADAQPAIDRFIATMRVTQANPPSASTALAPRPAVSVEGGVIKDLRSALTAIRADDHAVWIKIGQCLHELGESGRSLWLGWSQTSEKWQPGDAHRWDTFSGDHAGYKGVFTEAQRHGWANPLASKNANARIGFGVPSDTDDDDLAPPPDPGVTEAMRYGLAGDVMSAASNGTEVHSAAAGLAFLSFAAVALGRERFVRIGNDEHHPRIYSVHVGRSALAGKGMAVSLTRRIREETERQAKPFLGSFTGNLHDGGLSSREGLAWLIRDPSDLNGKDGIPIDDGVTDKRIFVLEDELANVLQQSSRDGNTLSSALRTAWDGHDLAPATKSKRTRATRPHIGIHACITPSELGTALKARELTNGFANRFLFCWAERCGIVPFPSPTPDTVVADLAHRLFGVVEYAKKPGQVTASTGATGLFSAFYHQYRKGYGVTGLVRGLIDRYPPYAWRLALVFALLDRVDEIQEPHMRAALAWLDYCRESTIRIFSTAAAEAEALDAFDLGRRVVQVIGEAGGSIDREPLRLALGKPTKDALNATVRQLIDACEIEEKVIARERGGRALRRYVIKT